MKYDGGLACGTCRDRTDPIPESFPPGSQVTIESSTSPSQRGTVQTIPSLWTSSISSSTDEHNSAADNNMKYTILFDDCTSANIPFVDLAKPTSTTAPPSPLTGDPFDGLPHFLKRGTKVTLDHNGQFCKGYLSHSPVGGFTFDVRQNARSIKVDWQLPLPEFKCIWSTLVREDVLIPGHSTVSSFLCPSSTNNALSANFVSAKNLLGPCPASLLQALHPSNPDRDIWLRSYEEEKGGLESLDVYECISRKKYLNSRLQGLTPKALPSMCVLVVKTDNKGNPDRSKSRIVVLGNHEDKLWKSQRYAPFYNTRCSIIRMPTMSHSVVFV